MTSITDRAWAVRTRRPPGRHRRVAQGALSAGFRSLRAESLFRNSAFLVTSIAVTAVGGFGALSLLTRLYSVQAVGLAAAALSAVGLISSTVQFGLNYSLPRFLPSSANRTALINTVLTVTMLAACAGAVLFLALPIASKLYALGGILFIPLFIIVTSLTAGSTQLQNVLIADRSSDKIVNVTVVGSLAKVAAPAIFLFLGIAGAFVAQSAAGLVAVAVLAVVVARRGHQFRPALNLAATRDLIRFSAGAYLGAQIGSLPLLVLPLIILSRFGANENAFWYTAMAIASLLYQLPGSVAKALLPETSHRPAERKMLIRRSAILIGSVMAPVLLIAYFAAPVALILLGHRYDVACLAPLRWLIIAGVMSSINYITGTILYIGKKAFTITIINAIDAVIVIGLAVGWAHNSTEIAIYWVVGEVFNVVLFAACAVRALHQVHGRWEALGGNDIKP
jgi:O-antigen/teichoic acid export membrane protein